MQVKCSLDDKCFVSSILDVFSGKRLDSDFQQDTGKRASWTCSEMIYTWCWSVDKNLQDRSAGDVFLSLLAAGRRKMILCSEFTDSLMEKGNTG